MIDPHVTTEPLTLRVGGSALPETLTDAELRIAYGDLGLAAPAVAERLGVGLRTVRRWESGDAPVPGWAMDQIGEWTDYADEQVTAWTARLIDTPDPVLVIPRGDRDGWPASWWRALAARIIERVPGLRVVYADSEPGT